MRRPRVYVSGPLTSSGNVLENLDAAIRATRALIDAGFAPFCPHPIDQGQTRDKVGEQFGVSGRLKDVCAHNI